jgi:hypothetical protein
MSNNHTHNRHKQSLLEDFSLAFEYDLTWQAVRKQTKQRTS